MILTEEELEWSSLALGNMRGRFKDQQWSVWLGHSVWEEEGQEVRADYVVVS